MLVFRVALLAASSVALSGCAAMVTAWKNDPLQSYDIERPTIYAMTGDRRTAVLMDSAKRNRFCAESLPDAVAAYSAASKANAGLEGKASGGFEDATTAGLLQTFQRTEIAEVYRQMGWNLCLAWAQGAIDERQYHALLQKYVIGGLDAISKRAAQPQTWPTVAHGSLVITPPSAAPPQAAGGGKPEDEDKPEEGDKPDDETKPGEQAPATDPPGTVDLGDGVKLQRAETPSGYCIKAAAGYVGGASPTKPPISTALPLCA